MTDLRKKVKSDHKNADHMESTTKNNRNFWKIIMNMEDRIEKKK